MRRRLKEVWKPACADVAGERTEGPAISAPVPPTFRALVLLAIAAIAVSACAGDTRRFYKEGAVQADYDRDSYECERDTRQVERSFGYGYDRPGAAFSFAVRCMSAKGYVYQ